MKKIIIPNFRTTGNEKAHAKIFDEWLAEQPKEKKYQVRQELEMLMTIPRIGAVSAKSIWVQVHCLANIGYHREERRHAKNKLE